jgi:hypothetical protein
LVGIIEEEEEKEKMAKISLELEDKRNNNELSYHISKIDFRKYLPNSEIMPVTEYIEIDDKTESSIEVTNTDIFNTVMQKEEKEEEGTAYLPPKITHGEAIKHLDSLMNYIQQSEEFSEEDYLMLDQLSTRLNEIREKKKVQANINNFMVNIEASKLGTMLLDNFSLNINNKIFE